MSTSRIRRILELPTRLRRVDRDVDDEIAFHLAMREASLRSSGLPPAQARERARRRFGNIASIRAACIQSDRRVARQERRMLFGDEIRSDVRLAVRSARHARGYTLTALLTIALGVGATTAVFTIVRGALMRPLPFPAPERIVRVYGTVNTWDAPLSTPNLRDLRAGSRTLSALGAYVWNEATVTGLGEPLRVMSAAVYGDFFGAMGVRPMLGRVLLPDETPFGAPRRVVVSYELWTRYLGGERRLDRLHLTLRGGSYEVVGVMPPGFAYPNRAQIWIGSFYGSSSETERSTHLWSAVGRLRSGVAIEAARTELDGIAARLAAAYGHDEAGLSGARVRSLREDLVGDRTTSLVFLFGAVALVLLIACVNVATAALARGEARRLELGIRSALGASRGRLMRQALTEHLTVATVGGAFGCVLAVLLTRALVVLGPRATGLPRLDEMAVDALVLAFAVLATLVAGTAIGILPAWQAGRAQLRGALARGGRGTTGDGSGARRVLVMAEVALAVALTVGAGLLVRSLRTLLAGDPGFDAHQVASVAVSLPESRYADSTRVVAYFDRLLAGVRATPGVTHASLINSVPYDGNTIGGGIITDADPATGRGAYYRLVGDDYFATLRVPLLRGRSFGPADGAGAPQVAVVTRAFASIAWPNENPIGRRFRWTPQFDAHDDWLTVIGVAENTKNFAADDGSGPAVYVSYRQRPERALEGVTMLLRIRGDARPVLDAVRQQMTALDPDVPVAFSSVDAIMAASVAYRRFTVVVMTGFGAFALFLAALGVYGVLAYAVARRRREIGIRVALGAARADVIRLVIRDAARAVVPGILLGVGAAVALTRTMRAMLYGVGTGDPVAFAGGLGALAIVASLACVIPAYRALRVDPTMAMRAE